MKRGEHIQTTGPEAKPAPAAGSRKKWLGLLGEVLEDGGPGYLQFAITNICNAKCAFCGFAADQMPATERHSVTLAEALEVVDVCRRSHIGYLLFVGGEPLVHRDLVAMVRYAAESGVTPMICTNGSLWTESNLGQLADAGLASVIMSIDTHDVARHEAHRGLPGVCRKIQLANEFFHRHRIQSTASVTASRLVEDYARLPDFLQSLGFASCTFSYPLTALAASYLSCSESGLVQYTTTELIEVFDRIKALKQRPDFQIVNPTESLTEMQRHLRGEHERFGCLGGHKYFYLDWHLNWYRCHAWDKPMCHLRDFEATPRIRDGCTRFMIDCYRDPSVLQYIAVSLSDAWQALKRGRIRSAAKALCDRRNLVSLQSVWEERRWIRKV